MRFFDFKKAMYLTVYAVAVSLIAVMVGCGGGGSYDAPDVEDNSWWTDYDADADALVSAETVAAWINNDYKTEDGDPVVIFDVDTDYTDSAANKIIGAVSDDDIEAFTIYDLRAEGPVDTVAIADGSARMVPKGATMDAIVQDLGLTKDTVLVLTSTANMDGEWNLTRGWWMFYYWGFSDSKIKLLNGGVAALAAVDSSLVSTTAESVDPADSVFSVKDLPGLHADARVSTNQVIDAVRGSSAVIIDARGSAGTSGMGFAGRIKDAIVASDNGIGRSDIVNADGTFKTKEELAAAFETLDIDSSSTIIVHCGSGYSATPIYFFIKEVMGFTDVALYDGSWYAWSVQFGYTITGTDDTILTAYTDGTNAVKWDGSEFVDSDDTALDPTITIGLGGALQTDDNADMMSYDTMRFSGDINFLATSKWMYDSYDIIYDVDTDYDGSGREIYEEDYEYVTSDDEDSDDSDDVVTPDAGSLC